MALTHNHRALQQEQERQQLNEILEAAKAASRGEAYEAELAIAAGADWDRLVQLAKAIDRAEVAEKEMPQLVEDHKAKHSAWSEAFEAWGKKKIEEEQRLLDLKIDAEGASSDKREAERRIYEGRQARAQLDFLLNGPTPRKTGRSQVLSERESRHRRGAAPTQDTRHSFRAAPRGTGAARRRSRPHPGRARSGERPAVERPAGPAGREQAPAGQAPEGLRP